VLWWKGGGCQPRAATACSVSKPHVLSLLGYLEGFQSGFDFCLWPAEEGILSVKDLSVGI